MEKSDVQTLKLELEELGTIMTRAIEYLSEIPLKRKRRTAFNDLVRSLKALNVIPSSADVLTITHGLDRNGVSIAMIEFKHYPSNKENS